MTDFNFVDPFHSQVLDWPPKPVPEQETEQPQQQQKTTRRKTKKPVITRAYNEDYKNPRYDEHYGRIDRSAESVPTKGYDGPFQGPGLNTDVPGMPVFFKHMGGYQPKNSVPKFERGMGGYQPKSLLPDTDNSEDTASTFDTKPTTTSRTSLRKLFGPSESELEAARNGMRWHWYMENRPMWANYDQQNDVVWKGVDRENQYLSQLIKEQKASQMTPLAQARRLGQYQNMYKQWEKMVDAGMYDDGDGGLSQTGIDAYNELYNAFVDEFPQISPSSVMLPLHDQISARKNIMTGKMENERTSVDKLDNAYRTLIEADQSGLLYDSNGQINAQMAPNLDLLMNYVAARITGSSGALADAEKVRLQYEYATEDVKAMIDKNIQEYYNSIAKLAQAALKSEASLAANEDLKVLAGAQGQKRDYMHDIATAIERLVTGQNGLPHDLALALDANSEAFEKFIERFMQQGFVDITKLVSSAGFARSNAAYAWNQGARRARRADRIPDMKYDYAFKIPARPNIPTPKYQSWIPSVKVEADATNQRIAKRYKSGDNTNLNNATGMGSGIEGWN